MTGDDQWLEALIDATPTNAVLVAAYDLLKTKRRLGTHRILTYRCPDRCLLLDVVASNIGTILYAPPYKLSQSINDTSSVPSARAERTSDGNRRWNARAMIANGFDFGIQCDHVRDLVTAKRLEVDLTAGTKEIIWNHP